MVICTWIAELMLSKISTVKSKNANNAIVVQNLHKRKDLGDGGKGNQEQIQEKLKQELEVLQMDFRQFVAQNKADLDTDTIF
jgi:hypothetical protein